MRQSTSLSTERTTQGAPWLTPGGTSSLELVADDELGLITRDVVIRTGALTGLLVAWNATEKHLDVICACGTAPSKEGMPLSRKRSGFVGRVLASGHTAGEPITVEQNPDLGAPASRGLVMSELCRYSCRARARDQALRPSRPRDDVLRTAKREGGGRVVIGGDVATGAGRGVAGGADRSVSAKHNLIALVGPESADPASVRYADPPRS